ncbi:unnamed protein product [Choristocarpus tenellus]
MSRAAAVVARSLKDASRFGVEGGLQSLVLHASDDLVCRNLMCEKVGEACVCRLAVTLSRLKDLRELDVSGNRLGILPDTVFALTGLERLDLSGNNLETIPSGISRLTELRYLHLSNNSLTRLPSEMEQLTRLEELHVDGNEFMRGILEETLGRLPGLQIVGEAEQRLMQRT